MERYRPWQETSDLMEDIDALEQQDYYKRLGVSRNASPDEIRKAFHRLSKRFHPDTVNADPELRENYSEVQKRISEAYNGLKERAPLARMDSSRFAREETTTASDESTFKARSGENSSGPVGIVNEEGFADAFEARESLNESKIQDPPNGELNEEQQFDAYKTRTRKQFDNVFNGRTTDGGEEFFNTIWTHELDVTDMTNRSKWTDYLKDLALEFYAKMIKKEKLERKIMAVSEHSGPIDRSLLERLGVDRQKLAEAEENPDQFI